MSLAGTGQGKGPGDVNSKGGLGIYGWAQHAIASAADTAGEGWGGQLTHTCKLLGGQPLFLPCAPPRQEGLGSSPTSASC